MKFNQNIERALLPIGLLLSAFVGFAAFRAVPAFHEVFQSYGPELPLFTSLAFQFYPALLALPLVVLALWAAWPRKQNRGLAALFAGIACVVLVPLLLALIMYLPIIRLGR